MRLLDAIIAENTQPKTICVFAEYMTTLSDEDREDIESALKSRSITATAIFSACRKHGYTGGDSVLRRHRRGECICL